MRTIILLSISNIFMTIAWYGHLKYRNAPLWIVILVSWGIAFFEYCFQVPANRIGYGEFNAAVLPRSGRFAKNHTGGNYTCGLFCFFHYLFE